MLEYIHNSLLKFIKETEVLFASLVVIEDYFHLRESQAMSRSEWQAKVPLVIKNLQK